MTFPASTTPEDSRWQLYGDYGFNNFDNAEAVGSFDVVSVKLDISE